jgi:hypothetical protein
LRVALVGLGAVGLAVARQLSSFDQIEELVVITRHAVDLDVVTAPKGAGTPGAPGALGKTVTRVQQQRGDLQTIRDVAGELGAVVLAGGVDLVSGVRAALERSSAVVVAADDPGELRRILALDAEARERGVPVVLGATMAPGLSFDEVEEVHVASMGTGGPACARRHHRALSSMAADWRDGGWVHHPGGSGRELVWFPEPVGGADCYRGALADPFLLRPAFEGVRRVTARLESTRRDRLTARLPMLRPPHPEGTVGALRVDVRGRQRQLPVECLLGATGRPAALAGMVAAQAAVWAGSGRLARPGVGGLAELVAEPGAFVRELVRRGVRVERFEGTGDDVAGGPGTGRHEIVTPAS